MKATIKWVDGVSFVGESGSGHSIVLDGAADAGGRNIGLRPLESMLIGIGTCSAFDIVNILRKGRQAVYGCRVELEAERADAVPSVFTRIEMRFVVTGRDIDPKRVARAIDLSADKYCSATAMMRAAGVEVSHGYEVVEEEDGQRLQSNNG